MIRGGVARRESSADRREDVTASFDGWDMMQDKFTRLMKYRGIIIEECKLLHHRLFRSCARVSPAFPQTADANMIRSGMRGTMGLFDF
jgi:hypothetical protein